MPENKYINVTGLWKSIRGEPECLINVLSVVDVLDTALQQNTSNFYIKLNIITGQLWWPDDVRIFQSLMPKRKLIIHVYGDSHDYADPNDIGVRVMHVSIYLNTGLIGVSYDEAGVRDE